MTITPGSGVNKDYWSHEFREKVEAEERSKRGLYVSLGATGAVLLAGWLGILIWWLKTGKLW